MDDSERDFMLGEMHSDIKSINTKLDNHVKQCVTRREFAPWRNGLIAIIGAVLLAVGEKVFKVIGLK